MADLTGTWLGSYWQQGEQTRFEMTLVQSGNAIAGNILDDGHLGEANLAGEVTGRTIRFAKSYISLQSVPINYRGTVSEDENMMSGTWNFGRHFDSGHWEAYRSGENLVIQRPLERQRILQSSVL